MFAISIKDIILLASRTVGYVLAQTVTYPLDNVNIDLFRHSMPGVDLYAMMLVLLRVPDYTVIVLHPERFAWSQIHRDSNETSTQVPEVDHGMLASLATPGE